MTEFLAEVLSEKPRVRGQAGKEGQRTHTVPGAGAPRGADELSEPDRTKRVVGLRFVAIWANREVERIKDT